MATLTLQLTTVTDNLSPAPATAPEIDTITTPVNANQAQGAPAPLDTVTLVSQSAQGQATGQNQQEEQFQNSPAVAAAATLFANAISSISRNRKPPNDPQTADSLALLSANSAPPQATLASLPGANQQDSAKSTRPDLTQSQQQELDRLDQALRQLGVDPQNISIFKQLALLFYANNPSALQQFVRQFHSTAQQSLQQGTAASLASAQDSGATVSNLPASTSSSSDASATAHPVASTDTAPSGPSQQFQDLQFAMAAVGGQVQLPRASATRNSDESSLDVTL